MRSTAYFSIMRMKLIALLQYRVAALASMSIHLFWGLILSTILMLFYRLGDSSSVNMNIAQGVTYIWFGQCFLSLIPIQLDNEIYQRINSGDYAYELCRPLDLYNHLFARAAAIRISGTVLKSTLALIICLFLLPKPYRMMLPADFTALLGTVVALIGALFLSCAFANIINLLLLKVDYGIGLYSLAVAIVTITSGVLIPLYVYPDWMQPLLRALPFAGMMDFPASIYTGMIAKAEIWSVLAKQLAWIIVLVVLGRWGMSKRLQKTIIQGG